MKRIKETANMIFRKMKALPVALAMVLALAACTNEAVIPEVTSTPAPTAELTPEITEPQPTEPLPTATPEAGTDLSLTRDEDGTIFAGTVKTAKRKDGDGAIGYEICEGMAGKDYTDEGVYTFNTAIADGSGLNWSPFACADEVSAQMLSYVSTGLYDIVLNKEKNGWSVVCEMAAELPVDVTSDYVGRYGIEEGNTARAWKIALNPNARWDEETPINADSYIYSFKELLNPLMQSPRAEDLCTGEHAISNAEAYRVSGREYWAPNCDGDTPIVAWNAKVLTEEGGVYMAPDGSALVFGLKTGYAWMEGHSLEEYYEAGYVQEEVWKTLSALADEEGYVPVTDESIAALFAFTGSDIWGKEQEENLENYMSVRRSNATVTWDEVGILKTGEYEIVLVFAEPVKEPEYRLPDWLSTAVFLVKEDLWESCKKYYNADKKEVKADSEEIASITTSYGTSAETTASFGPYKLTSFRSDKQITFERNEQWYCYTDEKHKGQYQTDVINIKVIKDHDAQLAAFLKGEIDSVALLSSDIKAYAQSLYLRYTPQSYTTKLSLNTDVETLTQRGSQVLGNENFRHAFSLALDRAEFASTYSLAGTPGLGLWNRSYICDPYTCAEYRDTEGAKAALVGLYGVRFGEGTDYADVAAAYESITGYDIEKAREYMQKAYEECVRDKTYDGFTAIELEIRVYESNDLYEQMVQFLNDALADACAGTGFEGRIRLNMKVDGNYFNAMYAGETDMIFSAWGGAPTELYSLLYRCYCDDSAGQGYQVEYGYDTSKVMVRMQVDGEDYIAPLQSWALWATGKDPECKIATEDRTKVLGQFADYDTATQAAFYGLMEKTYLGSYTAIPIYYRNTATLVSAKGDYAVKEYLNRVGYGGLRFYTYWYTDDEWKTAAKDLTY